MRHLERVRKLLHAEDDAVLRLPEFRLILLTPVLLVAVWVFKVL